MSGAPNVGMSNSATAKANTSGISTSQILPPVRPLRGLRGERSQSASRRVDQRRLRCSWRTRAMTSTNCQIRPTMRQTVSAFTMGRLPSPESRSATAGATSHASAAIGRAAAAQTARIARRRYCGISTLETAASLGPGVDPSVSGWEVSSWEVLRWSSACLVARVVGSGVSWCLVRSMTVLLLAGGTERPSTGNLGVGWQ